jgi:acyl carrier protein
MSHGILDDENIKNEIKRIFLQVFPTINGNLDWGKHQKDYDGWDSFAQLQLITMAEEFFKIEINLDDAITIISAQKLFDCVRSLK